MGYGGSGSGGGGSGGSGGGSGASGGSGYRRVGDDRTANLKVNNITSRDGKRGTDVDGIVEVNTTHTSFLQVELRQREVVEVVECCWRI